MWARATRISNASPEQFAAIVEWTDATLVPALRQMEGYAGIAEFGSPDRQGALTITFWYSEEALNRSAAAADALRSQAASAVEGVIAAVDVYEVAYSDFPTG